MECDTMVLDDYWGSPNWWLAATLRERLRLPKSRIATLQNSSGDEVALNIWKSESPFRGTPDLWFSFLDAEGLSENQFATLIEVDAVGLHSAFASKLDWLATLQAAYEDQQLQEQPAPLVQGAKLDRQRLSMPLQRLIRHISNSALGRLSTSVQDLAASPRSM
jgi:hypothetical protein